MVRFNVSYDQVTEESAESGSTSANGYVSELSRLRDAIKDVSNASYTRYDGCSVETDSADGFDTVRVYFNMCYAGQDSGITETRYLHIPENVTCASRGRIKRLVESFRYD